MIHPGAGGKRAGGAFRDAPIKRPINLFLRRISKEMPPPQPQHLPLQCGPSSEPSKQSWSPLHSLLMWMHSSVPRQLCSLGWHRDTLL